MKEQQPNCPSLLSAHVLVVFEGAGVGGYTYTMSKQRTNVTRDDGGVRRWLRVLYHNMLHTNKISHGKVYGGRWLARSFVRS